MHSDFIAIADVLSERNSDGRFDDLMSKYGREDVLTVLHHIKGWFYSSWADDKLTPFEIGPQTLRDRIMPDLLSVCPQLSLLCEMKSHQLVFRDSVEKQEVDAIADFLFDHVPSRLIETQFPKPRGS